MGQNQGGNIFLLEKCEEFLHCKSFSHFFLQKKHKVFAYNTFGPGWPKLTMSLVNVWLKFQMLISQTCKYFLLKKCEKLLSFFQQKISVYLVIKSLNT